MITPNVDPRHYQWQIAHTATYTLYSGIGHSADSTLKILWGNPFQTDVHGIQVNVQNLRDFGGTETFSYSLLTPWGVGIDFADSESGWQDRTVRLDMDDVVLTVNAQCEWTLEFSELRFYIDDTMGGWILKHTITSQSEAGIDFDYRLNHSFMESNSALSDIVAPSEGSGCTNTITCLDDWYGTSDHNPETNSTTSGGWRWMEPGDPDWTNDEVRILPVTIPSMSCDCSATQNTIEFDVNNSSFAIQLSSKYSFDWSKVLGCSYTCEYADVKCTEDWEGWFLTEEWDIRNMSITAVDINSPIFDHVIYGRVECNASTDEDSTATTEVIAYSEFVNTAKFWSCLITCDRLAGPPCTPGLDPPVCSGDCPTTASCFNKKESESEWPNLPPCADTVSQLDCCHFWPTNEYYAAYIKRMNVWVRRNTFSLPIVGYTQEVQITSVGGCSYPAVAILPADRLYVAYVRGGNSVYKFSNDQGRTWSNEISLITNSKYPRMAIGPDGTIVWSAFKYISGSSGPGKIHIISYGPGASSIPSTVIAKDETGSDIEVEDDTFDISFSSDPHGRWLLFAKRSGETSPTHFASADDAKTFVEVYS